MPAVLEVPEAAAALAAFVMVGFLLLFCLAKGFLPERQQLVVWFLLTALLFCLCSVLVRHNVRRADSCLLCAGDSGALHTDPFKSGKANAQRPKLLLPEFLGAAFYNPPPPIAN
jgi:hypothetical protein